MAEVNDDSEVKPSRQPPRFVEVLCKSSGKIRRFSSGTEAGFAVNLINKKVLNGGCGAYNILIASHIEAVKEGEGEEEEEPVSFGPNSMLVDYGPGWKLQTVVESYGGVNVGPKRVQKVSDKDFDDSDSTVMFQSPVSCMYISKILFAFALLFVFGAIFTLGLENLPRLILYINSFM